MNISALDSAIIVAYLLVVVAIAVVSSRRVRNTSDFFLAGRSMRWPFVGASMFATNISAEQFVGQAGLVFVVGLAVANYQLAGVLAFVAMGAIFLPIYMRLGPVHHAGVFGAALRAGEPPLLFLNHVGEYHLCWHPRLSVRRWARDGGAIRI